MDVPIKEDEKSFQKKIDRLKRVSRPRGSTLKGREEQKDQRLINVDENSQLSSFLEHPSYVLI